MISFRYLIAVICLLGLALIPTVIHTYVGFSIGDGRVTTKIADSLGNFRSIPTDRKEGWVKKNFDTTDWIERRYIDEGQEEIFLFVASSFDHKRLYHHPEIALLPGTNFIHFDILHFSEHPHIPVFMLRHKGINDSGLALYALMFEGRGIENPYWFQMNNIWSSMLNGRKPMTLFFVYDPVFPTDGLLEKSIAGRILFDAIQSFISQSI